MKTKHFFFLYSKSIVFTLAVMLFMVDQVIKCNYLDISLALISMLAIVISLSSCHFFSRVISIVFLGLGTWMVWKKGIDFLSYVKLNGDMLYLLSLFAVVPLLSIPIQVGGYREAFERLFDGRVKSVSQLYRVVTALSYFLGTFLNMATIPLVHSSVKSVVKAWPIRNHKRFLASGIIQGYSLPIIWTPFSGIVGVVLHVTHVRWVHIFPILLAISLATMVFNWIIFSVIEGNKQLKITHNETAAASSPASVEEDSSIRSMLLQIIAAIVLLLVLVVSIDSVSTLGLVVIVTLFTVPFSWIWCLLLKKSPAFWAEVKNHFKHKMPEMSESFAVFLTAGFFVEALRYSGNDHLVNQLFIELHDIVGIHIFVFLLPFIVLFLSFVGLHPIVVVNLLAQSLTTDVVGISTDQMAVAFLGGAVMTFFMGPFSGTLGLMSSMIQVAPLRIASWSVVYVIAFSLILTAAILLL
ncbi:hypothetical protein PP175_12620 [Aneurinibacillus sp. Ricciae_BoGa-3]|uniref:hypothetical protein n=1 Tax=Aneurinibacillus sp. Ricciae_BoGa-3 TaxID=3022697 RepID=UPI002341D260|nr:hypothetical protein [Aneurinibacillus sp. Ricciae_BoGa-3]WCK56682.1 hypothetical protein PP175_12620 [Aneurinibacillus sp. Ricciae_BoGa-3]